MFGIQNCLYSKFECLMFIITFKNLNRSQQNTVIQLKKLIQSKIETVSKELFFQTENLGFEHPRFAKSDILD